VARTHFAEGQILFTEGDSADSVFRLLRGTVDVLRELDGYPILGECRIEGSRLTRERTRRPEGGICR
jgi:CRP-like cAMP-binding protein